MYLAEQEPLHYNWLKFTILFDKEYRNRSMKRKKTTRPALPWAFLPAILLMAAIFILSAQPADESSALSDYAGWRFFNVANEVLGLGWTQRMIGQMTVETANLVRKIAHFSEYLLLAIALRHGFRRLLAERSTSGQSRDPHPDDIRANRPIRELLFPCGQAFLVSALYAVSDEIHQHFVPGRSPMLRDVAIDCAGALAGILFCLVIGLLKRQIVTIHSF